MLSHITSSHSPQCWRNCSSVVTYTHCWLQCPKLEQFWMPVQSQILLIRIQRPINPWSFIPQSLAWQNSSTTCERSLLVAAKSAIAQSWREPSGPSLSLWHQKLWDQFVMEKITTHISQYDSYPSYLDFSEKMVHGNRLPVSTTHCHETFEITKSAAIIIYPTHAAFLTLRVPNTLPTWLIGQAWYSD